VFGYAARMTELRVNVDDVQSTAASYQASSARLATGGLAGPAQSFQPTAAAVEAVHAGAATARAALSARAVATGAKFAAADARYVAKEGESAAKLQAVNPQVV
jgi:hypothetical protein